MKNPSSQVDRSMLHWRVAHVQRGYPACMAGLIARPWLLVVVAVVCAVTSARAVTTTFFDITQGTNLVASGTTSDTISSQGYEFTLTRDKLFTGGVGLTNPIGRYIRIPWPDGLEAQAVTSVPNPGKARIDIRRQDGARFALGSFTARLLANTSGAGGALEVMPMLNGEDALPEPIMCGMTGYAGQSFAFITPQLVGFDAYKMTLYVDYALMTLTVVDASVPHHILSLSQLDASTIQISWPATAFDYILESAASLPAEAWAAVTNTATLEGDMLTVHCSVDAQARFYRLRK